MSNNTQIAAHTSLFARLSRELRALGRDRRGAEFVEILVVVALFALAGIVGIKGLGEQVNTTAGQLKTSISTLTPWNGGGGNANGGR